MKKSDSEPLKVFLSCRVECDLTAADKLELLIPMLSMLGTAVEIIEDNGATEIRVGPHNDEEMQEPAKP